MATGWLNWPPQTALHTPVPLILSAVDGKIEFIKMTNPQMKPKGNDMVPAADGLKSLFANIGTKKVKA